MSELKAFDITVAEEYYCEGIVKYRRAVYNKSEADKVIAELKEAIEDANANAIKWQDDLCSMIAELRETKRALWLARALRARDIQRWWLSATLAPITERACRVWNNIEIKCLKKVEEYR